MQKTVEQQLKENKTLLKLEKDISKLKDKIATLESKKDDIDKQLDDVNSAIKETEARYALAKLNLLSSIAEKNGTTVEEVFSIAFDGENNKENGEGADKDASAETVDGVAEDKSGLEDFE